MKKYCGLALLSLFCSGVATAYDLVPEYRHVWQDRSTLNFLERVDSEYTSDYVLYQMPSTNDQAWIDGKDLYQVSVGSLSGKEFAQFQRLNFSRPLSSRWKFAFNLIEEGDYDKDSEEFFWIFSYQASENWTVQGFGNTDMFKAENDFGFSIIRKLIDDWTLKLTFLQPDFQRNKRQQDQINWSRRPEAYSLVAQKHSGILFHNLFFRYEPNSVRVDGNLSVREERKTWALGGRGVWETKTFGFFDYRFQYDSKREVQAGTVYESQRVLAGAQETFELWQTEFKWGVDFVWREIQQGLVRGMYSGLLPAFWYMGPIENMEIGVQGAWHDQKADTSQTPFITDMEDAVHSRLNLKYGFQFGAEENPSDLSFLMSFDLDGRRGDGLWEGGAAQFNMLF